MGSALPLGDPAPLDGLLPGTAAERSHGHPFGVYLHVPFCRVRCGYCDFNTYTSSELRGVKQVDYAGQAELEVGLAKRVLATSGVEDRPVSTVFFGGGTPTLLPSSQLIGMLRATADAWGLADDAEVTTEANPDSVDAQYLAELAAAGFTRVSFGMQSAVPHVLATLDRTHDPERVPEVVRWARDAGLQVSLDLIYGTPGETIGDWERSLDAALAMAPDHLSAYALIVEQGTKLARQIRSGVYPQPDDDLEADMYELADARLASSGYEWYEVSNWSRSGAAVQPGADAMTGPVTPASEFRSRHNLAYWQGHDWWGIGPGAHSHIGGTRWWNVKHPAAYADRILAGHSPAAGRETPDPDSQEIERILLLARIRSGLTTASLAPDARREVASLIADGLVNAKAALAGSIELTLRGRLLADAVVRRLT
ncbi:coproporphyrinogen-III oxidase family protein [Subtercola boreus]|uniref:Heme chaperone HemW n=1 Tax=Subtercola boreus TaxID=120213 RepID=A0A3E0WEC0_9MICO|nr:coproporphyrinogen-III oxidase family protein [Subtercola boreus]RFA21810.1 coproporphyrinogen III oxidase [Subtercola boreus]RFA21921.1 coproporphyrinogen III oxidase [Subtercola boreus]RFA27869.1 coproporphyrinogen III oxidase [Subtercola boreus]